MRETFKHAEHLRSALVVSEAAVLPSDITFESLRNHGKDVHGQSHRNQDANTIKKSWWFGVMRFMLLLSQKVLICTVFQVHMHSYILLPMSPCWFE